jgi:hypothetical protein
MGVFVINTRQQPAHNAALRADFRCESITLCDQRLAQLRGRVTVASDRDAAPGWCKFVLTWMLLSV